MNITYLTNGLVKLVPDSGKKLIYAKDGKEHSMTKFEQTFVEVEDDTKTTTLPVNYDKKELKKFLLYLGPSPKIEVKDKEIQKVTVNFADDGKGNRIDADKVFEIAKNLMFLILFSY